MHEKITRFPVRRVNIVLSTGKRRDHDTFTFSPDDLHELINLLSVVFESSVLDHLYSDKPILRKGICGKRDASMSGL